jgi:hypothetical protein
MDFTEACLCEKVGAEHAGLVNDKHLGLPPPLDGRSVAQGNVYHLQTHVMCGPRHIREAYCPQRTTSRPPIGYTGTQSKGSKRLQ